MNKRLILLLLSISLNGSACAAQAPDAASAAPSPAPTIPDDILSEPAEPISEPLPGLEERPLVFSERVDERTNMVDLTITSRDVSDPSVVQAMLSVPRHAFVLSDFQTQAYNDHPLPIGYGQTISQPYIVAIMTQIIQPEPDDVVLEIGTGSGYQAAVVAEIVAQVYSIEIVSALADRAMNVFASLDYTNITVKHADGYFGWEEHAPFDAIIVTAAPDHVPPPLKDQLADGGRMILPVGPPGGYQELWLVERSGDQFTTTSLGGVRFVPFTRDVRDE